MEIQKEVWKDVIGYESIYEVSNFGRVKSIKSKKEKLLKGRDDSNGYLKVALYKNKTCIQKKIHRLVALVFIENPYNKKTVNHINGIKSDNRLKNLEWATYSENSKHSFDNNLQAPRKGVENNKAKLTEHQVLEIRNYKGIFNTYELGIMYGVNNTTIGSILNRKTWKHI